MYYNHTTEKHLLASMMIHYEEPEIFPIFTELVETDFETEKNKVIWRAGKELTQKEIPCDPMGVNGWLLTNKVDVGHSMDMLKEVASFSQSSAAIPNLINQLKDLRKRRTLRDYTNKISVALNNTRTSYEALEVVKEFPTFEEEENHMHSAADMVKSAVAEMIERKKTGDKITGIVTGFKDIDRLTMGLQRQEMSIVGAQPSIGKSVFAFDVSRNAAKSGKRVVFFSLEMSKKMLADRMLASELMVEARKIKLPAMLNADDQRKMNESNLVKELETLHMCDDPTIDLMGIQAKCKEIEFKYGKIDMIVVDYLQYMRGDREEYTRIGKNSTGLKNLAKQMDMHVMVISSMSRAASHRATKEPEVSDLRGSGQIEFDADVIILLHRDVKAEDIEERNKTQFDISKHRNGATGKVQLMFMSDYVTFKSMERGY